jgi:protocatechuate 3,4-dioxygenase beta subunit
VLWGSTNGALTNEKGEFKITGLKPGFYYNELRRAMAGHILASAVLKGVYSV